MRCVQKHQLIAFRRIAAKVYKKNLKWKKAVNMATKDGLFVDAMETASQSGSPELVKDLLSFFIEVCSPTPSMQAFHPISHHPSVGHSTPQGSSLASHSLPDCCRIHIRTARPGRCIHVARSPCLPCILHIMQSALQSKRVFVDPKPD